MPRLLEAAQDGLWKEVESILSADNPPPPEDLVAMDEKGWTTLHYAAYNGQETIVSSLINAGCPVNSHYNSYDFENRDDEKLGCPMPLHLAAHSNNTSLMQLLLKYGADIHVGSTTALYYFHVTPLHCAVINRSTEAIQFLLDKGADVDAQDSEGYTSLHHSANLGLPIEIAELLLKAGANPNIIADDFDIVPLHLAARKGHKELAKALLAFGAEPNADDGNPSAPIHYAMSNAMAM